MRQTIEVEGVVAIITDQKPQVDNQYDESVLGCHKMNCGYYILDSEFESPIDNEYELEAIYEWIADNIEELQEA